MDFDPVHSRLEPRPFKRGDVVVVAHDRHHEPRQGCGDDGASQNHRKTAERIGSE